MPRRMKQLLYAGYLCERCDFPLYHNDPRESMVCGICKLKHTMSLHSYGPK